jgi:hypothetical protein
VLSGFSKLKEAIGWGSSASILANRRESEKATLLTSATGTPVDRLPFLARRCFTWPSSPPPSMVSGRTREGWSVVGDVGLEEWLLLPPATPRDDPVLLRAETSA